MRTIDVHAHLMPQCLWRTVDGGGSWYGTRFESGPGLGATVTNGRRSRVPNAKVRFTPEERLRDMDALRIDTQVVSIHTPLFGYDLEPAQGGQLARDVNDEIAAMTRHWPRRFAGLATLPLQDVGAARFQQPDPGIQHEQRKIRTVHVRGRTPYQPLDLVDPVFLQRRLARALGGKQIPFKPLPSILRSLSLAVIAATRMPASASAAKTVPEETSEASVIITSRPVALSR